MRVIKRMLHTHPQAGRGGVSMKRTIGNNTGIYGKRFGAKINNAVRGRR